MLIVHQTPHVIQPPFVRISLGYWPVRLVRPRLTLPSCIASVDPVLECRRMFVGLSTKMWVELYNGIARFGIMSTECMVNLQTNLENPKTYGLSGSVGYLGHGLQGRGRIRGLSEIVETASPRIQRPQLRFTARSPNFHLCLAILQSQISLSNDISHRLIKRYKRVPAATR